MNKPAARFPMKKVDYPIPGDWMVAPVYASPRRKHCRTLVREIASRRWQRVAIVPMDDGSTSVFRGDLEVANWDWSALRASLPPEILQLVDVLVQLLNEQAFTAMWAMPLATMDAATTPKKKAGGKASAATRAGPGSLRALILGVAAALIAKNRDPSTLTAWIAARVATDPRNKRGTAPSERYVRAVLRARPDLRK